MNILLQNLTHHQFFSQYVDAIAVSFSIWDNKQQPISYYEKLAWGGLEASNAYIALSTSQKNAIQTAILDENFDRSGAKSIKCNN